MAVFQRPTRLPAILSG